MKRWLGGSVNQGRPKRARLGPSYLLFRSSDRAVRGLSGGGMKSIFGASTNLDAGKRPVRTEYNLYARIIRQARPYWRHLLGVFLLSTLASPISLLVPLPLKIAVDSAIASHPLPPFLAAVLP